MRVIFIHLSFSMRERDMARIVPLMYELNIYDGERLFITFQDTKLPRENIGKICKVNNLPS